MTSDSTKYLEDLLETDPKKLSDKIDDMDAQTRREIADALKASGVDLGNGERKFKSALENTLKTDKAKIQGVIDAYYGQFDAAVEKQKTIAQAKLSEAFDISGAISGIDYSNISEEMQDVAYQIVNSLDYDFFKELKDKGQTVESWVTNMLNELNSLSKEDSVKIESAFDLQTQFNGGEISYGEYVSQLKEIEKTIDGLGLNKEIANQIKLSLDIDKIEEEYNALLTRLTSKDEEKVKNVIGLDKKVAEKFLKGLSSKELSVATKIIPELDAGATIEQIQAAINREMAISGLVFDLNIDVETAGIEALNTALSESVTATGLSADSISALKSRYAELAAKGYDLSVMFEETSNGIHLNKSALNELEKAYAKQKLDDVNSDLSKMEKEYDLLTDDINNCTDATKRADLYTQRNALADKINEVATLATQYKGLTSAYNAWLKAEESGQERDMYENVIKGFEGIDDEIARGWVDDGTIKFLELLTGKDLSAANIKEVEKAYKGLDETIKNTSYSVRDFFTVDEDGNSTNAGVYNFLDAIGLQEEKFGGKDVVQRKNGKIIGFNFDLAAEKDAKGNIVKGGDQVIAETLGISEELVQIMVRASSDAGFVVKLDGSYTHLADLKNSAEQANDTLKKLKSEGLKKLKDTDLKFNFGANNLQDLNTELEKATDVLDKFRKDDGTIDMSMEGAEEALEIAQYFTATLDRLTEPSYMKIDASQVDKELQDPLKKMKEFEGYVKKKHLLKLTGDTKELKETEKKMEEIAKELEGLDEKTKIELGIDTDWTYEEIQKNLEKGEIDIPATVSVEMEMSDDIKDMRLLMMRQLGLVSDEEVKLKVGYEINDSVVDKLSDEEKKVVIKYIEDNKDVWDKYSKEEKTAVVKIIADGTNVEKWKPEEKEALVKYVVDGGDVSKWTPEEKQAFAKYLVDGGDVEGWSPEAKNAFVKYLVDGGDPDKFDPENKESWVVYKKDSSEVDSYQPKPKTLTINAVFGGIKNAVSNAASAGKKALLNRYGIGEVDGTANVNGTTGRAFKQGSWGTKNSGTALVGEFGRETLVRDGKYYTIGDTGAEFIKYQRGDIIFNHKQTEELFNNGRVTSGGGRAKALVGGTAFSSGTGGIGKAIGKAVDKLKNNKATVTTTETKEKEKKKTTVEIGGSASGTGGIGKAGGTGKTGGIAAGSKSSDASTSAKNDFKETIDWIEIAIERIEREIDNLDQKANNIYKSWSSRNSALVSEIGKVEDEISLQQKAYDRYIKQANGVGLSSSWAEKVRNGKIDISTIKDESLAEKIKDYQNWYEKALECKDAIEELKEQEAELYVQRVENVATQYEGILGVIEHEKNMLDEYISQNEANAQLVSGNYYKALINNERDTIAELEKQKSNMLSKLQEAMNAADKNGNPLIAKGSEAWYEMVSSIDEVTLSIAESQTQLVEYQQILQQLSWETFDLLQDKISAVTEESEFLIELLSSDKLYDDKGQLTDSGMATMGLHGQNYNTSMYQADLVGEEIKRLEKEMANDPFDTELEERYREMISLQQDYILSAQDSKEAIRDMVEEGINLELDALQEVIDKKNEALDAERDLYEYQKKVKEQTKEIASLEKQMAAYSGDTSEEAQQKIQQIKVDLENAKTDLQETEYDKMVSDSQEMLDTLYGQYEEILNTRLDNLDALVSDMITEINTDANTISTTLSEKADAVGYTLSDSMSTIWNSATTGTNDVITTYGDKFTSAQTTTNNTLSTINTNLQGMITQLNSIAKTDVKSASTPSAVDSKQANTAKKETKKDTTNKTTAKTKDIKVGGKINAKGAKIYDYAGDKSGESQYYGKDPIYKILKKDGNWLQVRWHKLSSGITGWFKKGDVKAYAKGKKKFANDEVGWTQDGGQEFIVRPSDGAILTPIAKGDSVLNTAASNNIWNMANSPAEFIKDNLSLGTANVPSNSNNQNSYVQNLDKVVFSFPNVKNYDEMLLAMQKDKNFERLVSSMSVDRLAGKSSLAKNKAIR